jgi:hypothetical protein
MKKINSVLSVFASSLAVHFIAGCVAVPVAPVYYPIVERMPKLSGEYPVRAPIAVQSRDRLIGAWDMEYECNSISVCNTMADPVELSQIIKNRYEFYDDGVVKLQMKHDGKEFNHVGEWSYENGVIGMKFKNSNTGRRESMEMTALWYSDTEVELRYADLRAYEQMFYVTPNIKSMEAKYAANGSLSTRMCMEHQSGRITSISIFNMAYSPMVMQRTGEVESDE